MGQDTATYDNDLAGSTAFVLVLWSSDGRIVNAVTGPPLNLALGALMTANNTNAPNAENVMSDAGRPNLYQVLYPPNGTPAGRYSGAVYKKAGASLVLTGASRDKPETESFGFVWDGTGVTILPAPGELVLSELNQMITAPGGQPQFTATALRQEADAGSGNVVVDHNYGGTDALRVLENGVPVDDATIQAYVASQYDAGTFAAKPPTTFTRADGRWIGPLMLDPADYVLVVSKANVIVTKIVRITVT